MSLALPTYDDVVRAAATLKGVAHRTPAMTSATADRLTRARVFFKCENLQRMGAFKFRGGFNAVANLTDEQRKAGVLTFSSGNHAQAVALSSKLLGVKATIGKGPRSPRVKEAQLLHQCLYMAALGGGAALLSLSILSMEVVAFPELGPEAVYLFKVRDFPLTVINDLQGGDFYLEGPARYREGRP